MSSDADPCESPQGAYGVPLHVGAAFIILTTSGLGVLSTLLGKHFPALRLSELAVASGKAAGTGIVLACALVHMLQPANESLTSPCVPAAFSVDYQAFAYLYAMLSALAMQALEYGVGLCITARVRAAASGACDGVRATASGASDGERRPLLSLTSPPSTSTKLLVVGSGGSGGAAGAAAAGAAAPAVAAATAAAPLPTEAHDLAYDLAHDLAYDHGHAHGGHGHSHGHAQASSLWALATKDGGASLVSALLMEFGFTVHSIFIGLAVGVVGDADLKPLIIALSAHQFFEGIALGARITDATLPGALDYAFALLFALSAPLGIGIGVAVIASGSVLTSGSTFLLVQGTFDGVCAGILLYIGFAMLLGDFPKDLARLCDGPTAPPKGAATRRVLLFAALWGGGGLMAFIGKYL